MELHPLSNPDLSSLIGLGQPVMDTDNFHGNPLCHEHQPTAGELSFAAAEVRELRAEVERLRCERDRLAEVQKRIMELLGTRTSDRLLHDFRNVLNERELYKALADTLEE